MVLPGQGPKTERVQLYAILPLTPRLLPKSPPNAIIYPSDRKIPFFSMHCLTGWQRQILHTLAALTLGAALGGCGTSVQGSHPLVQKNDSAPYASVYFIRPGTERFMGFADNRLFVEADGRKLVSLVKGEYTLAQLRPGQVWLRSDAQTTWGPSHRIKHTSRSRSFRFTAGQTYFIVLRPVNGEFRGVYFVPQDVDLEEARLLATGLRARGPARHARIPAPAD